MPIQEDLVSEAAQTQYRDSETQFLEWDIAESPNVNPDKFYRGIGLHYPVLYDPAWPEHIAHRRKEKKRTTSARSCPTEKKQKVPGSYALTGVTLGAAERRPIKKTLLFPHRNTDLPFRQPPVVDVRDPVFEYCESLTLQVSWNLDINEIDTRIILKSILDNLSNYEKTNKEARILALQKLLKIQARPKDNASPFIKQRGKPKWRQAIEDKEKKLAKVNAVAEPEIIPQIIVVNDGPKCPLYGFSASLLKHFCPIHNIEEKKEEDIKKIDDQKDIQNEVDEEWCRMCSGKNLHRKLYGGDHDSYPPAPTKPKDKDKEEVKEVKKGPQIWCPVCKGYDLHRKVYEWPPREEEKESSDEDDDTDWCPMCQGYKVHRKLYGEDYNDYPNPPYKDPTKDKDYKGIYCPWCKGYSVHRQVHDWPSLG